MKEKNDAVEVEIRPRFPLFGGWKTKYTLGYNVPSYELLFISGNDYVLKIPFLDHVYDDMIVDKLTLKVGSQLWGMIVACKAVPKMSDFEMI